MSVNRSANTQKYAFTRRECLFLAYFVPSNEDHTKSPHTQIDNPISYLKSDIGVMNQSVLDHFTANKNEEKIESLKKFCATHLCPDEEINKALKLPLMELLYLDWYLTAMHSQTPVLNKTDLCTNVGPLYQSDFLLINLRMQTNKEDISLRITTILDICFIGSSETKTTLLSSAQANTEQAKGIISGLLQLKNKLGEISSCEFSNWICNYISKFNIENRYVPHIMTNSPQVDENTLDKAMANCMIMSSQNYSLYKLFEGNAKRAWTQQKYKLKNTDKFARNYTFSKETIYMINELSEKRGLSKTELVERLVKEEYEKQTKKPPRI